MKSPLVPLISAMAIFCANNAHAAESVFPMPNCNSKVPECGQWQQSVQTANSMAAQTNSGGGGSGAQRQITNKQVWINQCVRYAQKVHHWPTSQATRYCKAQLNDQ